MTLTEVHKMHVCYCIVQKYTACGLYLCISHRDLGGSHYVSKTCMLPMKIKPESTHTKNFDNNSDNSCFGYLTRSQGLMSFCGE